MAGDALTVQSGGTDLIVDSAGPDAMVVQMAGGLTVDVYDDPLDLMFAAVGLPGRDGVNGEALPVTAVAGATMAAGTPVAIDRTTARMIAADAAYKPTAFVVGLLIAGAVQDFVANAAPSRLALDDWSAVTGVSQLAPGQSYFLAVGGGLTPTPPDSECVALVGRAISPTTMLIDPQPPIAL
jgi:hypothetical protein